MESLKDQNYQNLRKEFWTLDKKYEEERKLLRGGIFEEANKILRKYEKEVEEEFKQIWENYGDPKIIFNNFKICLEPYSNHNYSLVKTLTSNEDVLDLEKIAEKFSEKERKHDRLTSNKEYKEISEKMKEILKNEGLYSRYSDIKEIKEFQEKFNVLFFYSKYYK